MRVLHIPSLSLVGFLALAEGRTRPTMTPAPDHDQPIAEPGQAPEGWSYGFINASIAVTAGGERKRVKVVSPVFAFCPGDQRLKAIIEDAQYQLEAEVRERYGERYAIMYRIVDSFDSRATAETMRSRELSNPMYTDQMQIGYRWVAFSPRCR